MCIYLADCTYRRHTVRTAAGRPLYLQWTIAYLMGGIAFICPKS
jgi:hypothetical protein